MRRTTKQSHLLSLFIKPQARLLPRNDGILDEILNGILDFGILFARILQTLKAKK